MMMGIYLDPIKSIDPLSKSVILYVEIIGSSLSINYWSILSVYTKVKR